MGKAAENGREKMAALDRAWEGRKERLARDYALTMLLIFPFFCTDGYFNILHDRTYFFWGSTAIFATAMAVLVFFHWHTRGVKAARENIRPKEAPRITGMKITRFDIAAALFLFSTLAASLLSGDIEEAMIGEAGRFQGWLMLLCYVVVYFILRRHGKFDKPLVYAFLISGSVSAVWGLMDFLGMDPAGWIIRIAAKERGDYMSSYGNVNTFAHAMGLFMAFAGALYILAGDDGKKYGNRRFYLAVFAVCSTAMVTGMSDGALISVAAFLVIMFLYSLGSSELLIRYGHAVLAMLLSFSFCGFLAINNGNAYADMGRTLLLRIVTKREFFAFVCMFLIVGLILSVTKAYKLLTEKSLRIIRKAAFVMTACIVLAFLAVFVDINLFGNTERYGTISGFLYITDTWGSNRGYIWKKTVEEYLSLDPLRKLIGAGPDMFKVNFVPKYREEMLTLINEVFDSPHSEPLQYLYTTGLMGFAAYYVWEAGNCINVIRKGVKENQYAIAAGFAVLVYITASSVNISVPITQGIVVVMFGLLSAEKNKSTA